LAGHEACSCTAVMRREIRLFLIGHLMLVAIAVFGSMGA
jgi:hypothetical protein